MATKQLRFRFNCLVSFEGPPGLMRDAAKNAGMVLGNLVNKTIQDRRRGIFLTVQDAKEIKVLNKRGLGGTKNG